ncbi:MAG: exosortase F system-associated protein [Flavobacteria bacterium RIFCSPLOWO2_12_FULL_35_11]|nr:MAG: exosortase F system-associated protein [Flavobacteria bacterium RIFCSPLOWO2_12_FULL_35_11]
MRKSVRIFLIIVLFLMLILIRAVVQPYFYDPLLDYFKHDYLNASIPELDFGAYFLNIFYRYALNSIISLGIIYLVFKDVKSLYFSIKFYVLMFAVLSLMLFVLLKFNVTQNYLLTFYVRRFLIQPLFVFILLPAFYYQKLKIGKSEDRRRKTEV